MSTTTALHGKIAVVTGGAGGLGLEVVRVLLRLGVAVHVPGRAGTAARLAAALGDEARAVAVHDADLSEQAAVERLFAAVGPLDILANIAGAFTAGPIDTSPAGHWHSMIAANATSVYLCCRGAIPGMKARGGGRIINVASVAATGPGAPGTAAYAASKAAVLSLTRSLSGELLRDRITVNAILPTTIDTEANRQAMPAADRSTWLDPAAVATVVGFLVGPDAAIITGAAIDLAVG